MPCTDPLADAQCNAQLLYEGRLAKASLCGIATVLTNEQLLTKILDSVDWAEAGVSRAEFMTWWQQHLHEDTARRQREADAAKRSRLRESSMSKLTQEERDALNLR